MVKDNIITVLDLGSSKAAALAGRLSSDGKIDILGLGLVPCRGIQQGTVVDIRATEDAIAQAVKDVDASAGITTNSVYISSGGIHIAGRSSHGTTAIRGKEVADEDIESVVGAAKAISFPQDETLIHILPQSFSIDGQQNIRQPLGMSGMRMEVNCYLISGISNTLRNLHKCASRCNLAVERIVVEQVADSYGALRQDEQESGVCLINIGAGSVKCIVIKDNAPVFVKTFPIGGENVTNDIAAALRIPSGLAEEYKRRYGCALSERVSNDEMVKISRVDYRSEQEISRQTLSGFIQPRYQEIFEFIEAELRKEQIKHMMSAGAVLVGGASRIQGLPSLAAEIMHASVRVGVPINLSDNSEVSYLIKEDSAFTSACGMLNFCFEERIHSNKEEGFFSNYSPFGKMAWFSRFNSWVGKNF